jgi:Flp pilus assembly protein TadG
MGRLEEMVRQKGQSFVEFSFLAIFLAVLLAGVADFGRAYFIFIQMRDAAQEGASYGSFEPNDLSGIEARVRDTMKDPVDLSDPSVVQVTPELTNPPYACSGFNPSSLKTNAIRVTIYYEMPIAVPFLGAIINSQVIPLEAKVEDAILRPPCS